MARPYELKRRAASQDETRTRIVDAAIELHQTIGPAATTITDIAQRAGVGRVTVYRHFPDEAALARACSGKYFEHHPFPDLTAWGAIHDPGERAHFALTDSYAYHRANEAMLAHVLADAREHPVMAPYHRYWADAADVLMTGRRARGRRRTLLRAAIAVALSFDTWRALAREHQLTDAQAVEVALRLTDDRTPA
jgi:AcrR family transcriptional regulator